MHVVCSRFWRGVSVFLLAVCLTPAGAQPAGFGESAPATGQEKVARDMVRALKAYAVYKSGDFEAARARYRTLAEQGSVPGMTNLASMYAAGEGGRRSQEQALYWYTKAARRGDANAMYQVARAYRTGRGAPTDAALADRWYRAAAEHDNPRAQWVIGRRLYRRGDHLAGLDWIRTAAWNGNDPRAQQFLSERGEGRQVETTLNSTRRAAVLEALAAIDAAAQAQDAAGIAQQISADAEIRVRRPNGAGWTQLTRAEFETLWRDTFERADDYAFRRAEPDLLAADEGVLAFSEIEERLASGANARTLDLHESATLRVVEGVAVIERLRLDIRD